ncbi:uncharacterized protein LOC117760527 [Hippoglossus hippoglossus]|uniref:uncharacterized protein LOC117760527 n=1 Tax=Hippoglossus hippoglossus TaxID=8267 RepID=UPI00148D517C|nr:uncharacterized protein LOC117760527 [Hippoglossus hippoglossus]
MELSFDKKMKHIISEKDAVIANVTNVKVALGHQNLELMAKLRGIQREVHPIQNEWKIKANALEDSLKAEQAEKKACYEKIKKLENLLKDREDSVIENVLPEQNNLELMAELRSVQTLISREWKTKVNALKERVKFEQGEKEACSEKIEDTEEKCAAKREDSLNEENMEFLMVQNTELQEPALTTASAEAGSQRRRRMNRKRN